MDPLQNITDRSHQLFISACRAWLEGHPSEAYDLHDELNDFFNEQPMLEAGGATESSVPPDHVKE